jgi:hypothetical protein
MIYEAINVNCNNGQLPTRREWELDYNVLLLKVVDAEAEDELAVPISEIMGYFSGGKTWLS